MTARPPNRSLTPAERRALLLAAVVMESGEDAVPHGGSRRGDDELATAHTIARSLSAALEDGVAMRAAAASLRAAAAAM